VELVDQVELGHQDLVMEHQEEDPVDQVELGHQDLVMEHQEEDPVDQVALEVELE